MPLFMREGEGIKLIPKGDPNEIEIIVAKRRGFFLGVLIEVVKIAGYIFVAVATGLAEAACRLFLG